MYYVAKDDEIFCEPKSCSRLKCGLNLQDFNQFMMRLLAKQQGQITLTLKVSITTTLKDGLFQIEDNVVLSDEVQIHVFEKIRLIRPPFEAREITIAPNTKLSIVSNK